MSSHRLPPITCQDRVPRVTWPHLKRSSGGDDLICSDSPIALSLGYVADSDPKEDPEEDSEDGPVDYPADRGNDDDDDSSDEDKEEEETSEEEEASEEEDAEEEEEEHLALANSVVAPVVDHVLSSEETQLFETDASAATPPSPPACRTTARISIRPEAPVLLPPEEEVERLLALPTPPPSPLISLSPPSAEERLARCLAAPALPSSPLPRLPHPYGSPNHVRAPPGFRAAMGRLRASSPLPPPVPAALPLPPLPSLPLPPLPALLVSYHQYEVGESSTAVPRPTGGRRVDYGFVGTLDAEARRQRAEAVGYGIRDTWVDPRETTEEIAPVTLEGVNTRVTELTAVQEQDTQEDLASAVHFELQGYRIHVWMQDHRMDVQDSFIAALTAQNNMPPKRTARTARVAAATTTTAAAATLMTTAAIE
ncbi:hypothetical protein Tco_0331387 [Tanacetum coccineum]